MSKRRTFVVYVSKDSGWSEVLKKMSNDMKSGRSINEIVYTSLRKYYDLQQKQLSKSTRKSIVDELLKT